MIVEFLRQLQKEKKVSELQQVICEKPIVTNKVPEITFPQLQPQITSKSTQLCQFCNERPHQYKCPRCKLLYCSLQCYNNSERHRDCIESFCKDQVTQHLSNTKASQKLINKTQKLLLDDFNQNDSSKISEQRLQELLVAIEQGQSIELSADEKTLFQSYIVNQVNLWHPWWLTRDEICIGVVEVQTKQIPNINLNEFGIDSQPPTQNEQDFKDDSDQDVIEVDLTNQSDFRTHFIQRYQQIPHFTKLVKNPTKLSANLPYLIVANLCSFLFVSRYFNGQLLDTEPEVIVQNQIKQLLNKDSELRVEPCFESAFFDFLRISSLNHQPEIIKQYQPQVLTDIAIVLKKKQLVLEAFLRLYDLMSHVESSSKRDTRRVIGLAKQKLIFYLSFIKSEDWPIEFHVQEFVSFYTDPQMFARSQA